MRNTRQQVRGVGGEHQPVLFSLGDQHWNSEGLHDGIAIDGTRREAKTHGGRHDHVKGHQDFKLVLRGLFFKDSAQERA